MANARILDDIKGGLVASTAGIAFSIANGALVYYGTLQPMLARGIGAGLLTTAIVCFVLALTSGFRPVVATANSATAAPLGAIMATLAPALATLPQDEAIATVYAFVAVATLAAGLVLVLLGWGRLGTVMRFIPHPVVAGFMGVSGALLVLGAIRFATGLHVSWHDLPRFLEPRAVGELAAACVFAALTTLVTRRANHPLALPLLLVTSIVLVNLAVGFAQGKVSDEALQSIYLAPRSTMPAATPILLHLSEPIAWDLIWPHLPAIAAYALLVTMSTLLTAVGLEAALNVDISFDREMRAQGFAVIASGLVGGFVGNSSVGSTLAGVASGARGRVTGIMAGVAAFLVLLFGRPLLPFIPKFVIAGFLLEVGFWIVKTWCIGTRRQMPLGEWALVLGVVIITVWIGMVPAIIAGIIGGCILFALDLSRIDIVRRTYGLNQRTSSLVRPSEELAILAHDGTRVQFIELNGTLFFGSAFQILSRVREVLAIASPSLVVLDLTGVVGGDSSTAAILARMRRLLAERGIGLAIAGGKTSLIDLLRAANALRPEDAIYRSRDQALEEGENAILTGSEALRAAPRSLEAWLTEALGQDRLAQALIPHLTCADQAPGTYLCREGDPTTTLLFIESGRVDVTVGSGATETSVRVFGPRTIAGEHGFVLQLPRTANLKVRDHARVWSLTRSDFDALSAREPELVIALLRDIVRLQSERLAFATRQNAALA